MLRAWKCVCGTIGIIAYLAALNGIAHAQQGNSSAALISLRAQTANQPFSSFRRNSRLMFPMPMMMPSLFPLFIEDGSMSSTLTLVNASALQTYATLTVRDQAGQAWQSPRINLAPHAQAQLEIATLLGSMKLHLTSGSIVLNQSPSLKAPSIVGQLTLSRTASSPVSYAEEEEFMPAMMPSHSLLSVAEASDRSPKVAITSTAATDQRVAIQCTRNGATSTHHITVPSNGQAILEPCDPSAGAEPEDGVPPSYPAAISITTDGPAGELSAFGITRHRNMAVGADYIGALQFFDPASFISSSLVFSGTSSGRSLTPENARSYNSKIAIANFGAVATTADLAVYRTSINNNVTPSSNKVVLPAASVVQISLGDLATSSQNLASVIVSTAAPPGTVLAKLISTSDAAPYQLEQLVKDARDEHNAGIHPWSLDNGSLSDLLLFNHSDGSQAFNVAIEAPGGTEWVKRITIAAHQTTDISVDALIADRARDDRGRLLPSSATHGTLIWNNGPGLGTGRMLIRNTGDFAAHSFSCGGTSSICGAESLGEIDLYQGNSVTLSPEGIYCNLTDGCTGDPSFDGSAQIDGAWSDNDSIATIDLGGNVQGKSPGSTNVYLYLTDGSGCDEQTSGNAVVTAPIPSISSIDPTAVLPGDNSDQITINGSNFGSSPTVSLPSGVTQTGITFSDSRIVVTVNVSLGATPGDQQLSVSANGYTSNAATLTVNGFAQMVVQSDRIGQTTKNPNAQSRFVTYQVQRVDGTPATAIPIAEAITFSGYNCTQQNPGHSNTACDGTASTSSSGIFTDEWGMFTGYTPSTCGENTLDHWQWCQKVGGTPSGPNPGVTFGTLNGFTGTSSSTINGVTNPPNQLTGTTIYP